MMHCVYIPGVGNCNSISHSDSVCVCVVTPGVLLTLEKFREEITEAVSPFLPVLDACMHLQTLYKYYMNRMYGMNACVEFDGGNL